MLSSFFKKSFLWENGLHGLLSCDKRIYRWVRCFFFKLWLYIATIIYGIFKYHINLHCNILRIERKMQIWVSYTKLVTLVKKYMFLSLLQNWFLSKLFSLDKWWTSMLEICLLFVCKPRSLMDHRNLCKIRILLWMCLEGKNDIYVSLMISKGNVVLKPLCNWTAFTTACFILNEGGPKGA